MTVPLTHSTLAYSASTTGLVRLVEEKGFEEVLSATDSRGLTVLHVAADAGQLDVLQHFVRGLHLLFRPLLSLLISLFFGSGRNIDAHV